MSKIQLDIDFDQLLEIAKGLSPIQKTTLEEAMWSDNESISEEDQQMVLARIERAKKFPETLLDWDEVCKTW